MTDNTCVLLRRRCDGIPKADDFEMAHTPASEPGTGEIVCETLYLSLDPYLRGKISGRHLSGAIQPGECMHGEAISRVLVSNDSRFQTGDIIRAFSGWQSHPVIKLDEAEKLDPTPGPLSTRLGILGMPGLTAYAGLLRLGEPKPGDCLIVSAASGPVGSMVGQIGKIKDCRVIGIAGSPEKCHWTVNTAGFDDCINYKEETLRDGLARLCPGSIDIYFDNVGGDVLQAAMENLALGARVVLCGLMDQYNTDTTPPGPNPGLIIKARATVRGLVVYDHEDIRTAFEKDCSAWLKEGKIHYKEDIAEGLEQAPAAFCRLMAGKNFGKAIVRINDE